MIGGQAEWLMGSPRVTNDVDLCYRRISSNFERLAAALHEVDARLRGAPSDLPFRLDARTLAMGCNFTFTTALGDLDILGHVEPIGDYDALAHKVQTYQAGRWWIQVIDLDQLLRIKLHINRPKDQDSILQLRAIKHLRETEGLR